MEERLNRGEYEAVRCLLGAVSYTAHANDDLRNRLNFIPEGSSRMDGCLKGLQGMLGDILRTIPHGQCKQLRNTMTDMEIRMVPKLAPMSQNVILDKDLAKGLYDAAMEKCRGCVEDTQSCRQCTLYKVLESTLPLDNYENTLICPYSISEWDE